MKFFSFILLICIVSCQTKVREFPRPANLVPKDSLVNVLEELMLVEQHIQNRYPQLNQFQKIAQRSGDTILKKNNITFERFDDAMDYYGSRQAEMKQIYEQILERMNAKMNKL